MTERDKVTVEDITGIVHTDETTNSVEEVKKLRGRNERFIVDTAGTLIDMVTRNTYDYVSDVCELLNELHEKNNELRLQLNLCSDHRNEFHRAARENANRVGKLEKENEQLKSFKQKVFDLIDKTIEEETQIAENIEEVAQETRPYAKAVNRITIITLEHLKLELQE